MCSSLFFPVSFALFQVILHVYIGPPNSKIGSWNECPLGHVFFYLWISAWTHSKIFVGQIRVHLAHFYEYTASDIDLRSGDDHFSHRPYCMPSIHNFGCEKRFFLSTYLLARQLYPDKVLQKGIINLVASVPDEVPENETTAVSPRRNEVSSQ